MSGEGVLGGPYWFDAVFVVLRCFDMKKLLFS